MKASSCIALLLLCQAHAFAPLHTFSHSLQKKIVTEPLLGDHEDSPSLTSTSLLGIPKMFRWLTDQYPNINRQLNEGLTSSIEVNNFYLDMNGIIHPCTHGNAEGQIIVLDETAMFKKIFLYVDR